MAGFVKNFVNFVKDAFNEGDVNERPFEIRGERSYNSMLEDTDTEAINVSNLDLTDTEPIGPVSDFIKVVEELEDYSEYWWCVEEVVQNDIPTYNEIDHEKIHTTLNKRIEAGQYPIIEIPENAMKALKLLNDPDFEFGAVANLINKSPGMAGEFLSLVNSSSYSRGVKINDLRVALPRVGRENVKAMLYLYSTKMSLASSPGLNKLAVKIVDHSYATAIIASFLSQRYFPDPDTAFLAGLLHDVGKLGILKAVTEDHDFIQGISGEIFEENFGNTFCDLHEAIGVNLATKWGIDDLVVSAIKHNHDFFDYGFGDDEQEKFSLSALINLSDTMAKILGKGKLDSSVNILDLASTRELNINPDKSTFSFLEDIPAIVNYKSNQ